MKKIVGLFLCLTLLSGMMLALVSCGEQEEPVGGGAQISVYLGDAIYDFDPQGEYTNDAALSVISLLFEPLFLIDDSGDLKNAAAASYSIKKSENKVIIKLRESYWDDGITQVKASDFLFSWQRLIRCSSSNPAATLLYDVKNAVAVKQGTLPLDEFGVKALNNTTLEITFEESFTAYTSFLRNLANVALSPLSGNIVSAKGEFWSKKLSSIATNGPFTISQYDIEEGAFTLRRNTGYHRVSGSEATADAYVVPNILKTVWNVDAEITDTAYFDTLLTGLTEKTVFYTSEIPCASRASYRSQAVINDLLSTYCYAFDNTNPLFTDAAVRTILSKVIDRSHILSLVTFGKAATGLVSYGVANSTKISAGFRKAGGDILSTTATMTVEQAKSALSALSYTPGAFTLTYLDTEADGLVAAYVSGLWEQLGYTVTLNPVDEVVRAFDDGGLIGNLSASDSALQYFFETGMYDVLALDYQMYSTNALAVLSTLTSDMNGSGIDVGSSEGITLDADGNRVETYEALGNKLGYKNEAYDDKVAAAYAEKDYTKRAVLLHEAEEILLTDMPLIPLLFNESYYLVNSDLKGITVDWFGYASFTQASQKNYVTYLPEDALVTTVPATTAPEEESDAPEET